ncbi:MAG: DNA translocase FtsK 4TM domain-containing protein [Opitutales bacterium]
MPRPKTKAAPRSKPKPRGKKVSPKISSGPRQGNAHPYWALILLALGAMVAVAMADFEASQTGFLNTDAGNGQNVNLVGKVGADIAYWNYAIHGLAAWIYPVFAIWLGSGLFFKRAHPFGIKRFISLALTIVSACGILNLVQNHGWDDFNTFFGDDVLTQGVGGFVGTSIYQSLLSNVVGAFGSLIVLSTIFVACGCFTASGNFGESIQKMGERVSGFWKKRETDPKLKEQRREASLARKAKKEADKDKLRQIQEDAKAKRKESRLREKEAAKDAKEAEAAAIRAAEEAERLKNIPPPKKTKQKPTLVTRPPMKKEKKSRLSLPTLAKLTSPEKKEEEEKPSLLKPLKPSILPKVKLTFMEHDREAPKKDENRQMAPELEPEIPASPTPPNNPADELEVMAPPTPQPEPEPEPEPTPPPPPPKPKVVEPEPVEEEPDSSIRIVEAEKVEKAHFKQQRRKNYQFPPLDLLQEPPSEAYDTGEDHVEKAGQLQATLKEFKVEVNLGEIHTGPVITRYEVTPAPGVRVEKISSLDKNIALGLRAEAVRILAPVPGKGVVGVEVPNLKMQPVCIRDIIESKAWNESKAEIPIALGKEVSGKPMVADLTKMPHLLIAGSTGSGKTVCINAIIASLLYKCSPEELRFIMVDPKIVEMQAFNALPHMLIPVVTEPKKVPGALKWLLGEMERRYHMFARVGVRNIAGFNARLAKNREEMEKAAQMEAEMTPEERAAISSIEVPREPQAEFQFEDKKLSYIVCIIDELADLMMVAPADIETGIARLAQLARAAGIHLIIATQRPSVNVITGVIKANLPSRISFKVSSKVDSRTILDQGGAEALIGKGDMLFTPPGSPNMVRAQGAFVSDEEINDIVENLKVNGPPQFLEEVQASMEDDGDGSGDATEGTGNYEDEMIPKALDVLKSTKRASTSMLQRRLRIGYNRAARLMEELEDMGVVGPENGSSPREILVDLDTYTP